MEKETKLFELPSGWVWIKLADITLPITRTNKTSEYPNEEFKYIDIEAIDNKLQIIKEVKTYTWGNAPSRAQQIVETDDILFSTVRPYLKNIAIVSNQYNKSIASSGFCVLRPFIVNPKYVFHYILTQNFIDSVNLLAKGTSYPAVTNKIILEQKIPLAPLEEQNQIVEKIETLFSKLDEAVKGLKKAKRELSIYKYALLKNGFEGKLTTKWREENVPNSAKKVLRDLNAERDLYYKTTLINWKEEFLHWKKNGKNGVKPTKPKEFEIFNYVEKNFDELPKLPIEWEWVHWNEILDYKENSFKRGPFGSSLTKSIFVKSGYKVYEQYCAINDDCSFERYYITREKYEELKSFSVRDGDYLISCSGVTLGRITQIPKKYKEGIINQALLRVRINNEVLNSKFFLYFFRSPYFQKQIFENSKGSAIPNIKGVKELKIIPIPLLTIKEQNVIVEILESRFTLVDNLEKTIDNVLNEIITLKHSILKKAFEGRLVNHTSRESIEKLLEGIQEKKGLYLESQRELNRSKPKQKKQMEEKKSILEILKESNSPISAQELWEKSTNDGDIERFYSEIKEIYHQIDELKSKTESLLSLKNESK